jgi:excisionase family DNA binding protein
MNEPRFLTVRQFAQMIGMHPNVAYRHVKDGTLPVARIGRTIRIPQEVVARMAQGGNAAGTTQQLADAEWGLMSQTHITHADFETFLTKKVDRQFLSQEAIRHHRQHGRGFLLYDVATGKTLADGAWHYCEPESAAFLLNHWPEGRGDLLQKIETYNPDTTYIVALYAGQSGLRFWKVEECSH